MAPFSSMIPTTVLSDPVAVCNLRPGLWIEVSAGLSTQYIIHNLYYDLRLFKPGPGTEHEPSMPILPGIALTFGLQNTSVWRPDARAASQGTKLRHAASVSNVLWEMCSSGHRAGSWHIALKVRFTSGR